MKLSKIATAVWILIVLLIPVHAFPQNNFVTFWHLFEDQPGIDQGGRANTVAVNPDNRNEMFAASDSGGLFKSMDRGLHWRHVDSLPVIFTQSVAYVDSNIVLVSAKSDFKAKNGGGVWRSDDGGATWKQALLTVPGFNGRLSAYGISGIVGLAVVGTSQGVFTTVDGGLSWTWSNPFGNGDRRVFSVLFTPGNPSRIYAGGPAGVRLNTLPLGQWTAPAIDPAGTTGIADIHAFGSWPLAPFPAFVVNGARQLFHSEDHGTTWTRIPSAPVGGGTGSCNGSAFLKTAMRHTDGIDYVDLYFGNRCGLHRLGARLNATATTADYSGTWHESLIDRYEPRDLAIFQVDPVLLATNGGLHNTADGGVRWTYVGGGKLGGYNALQVTEVKGQFVENPDNGQSVPGSGTTDLYFGTQDNNLWATTVWANAYASRPAEGFFIEAERTVPSRDQTKLTYIACGPCRAHTSGQYFDLGHDTEWPDAPGGRGTAPVLVRRVEDRHHYVQNVTATNVLQSGLALTETSGDAWRQYGVFPEEPRGIPRLARAGAGDFSIVYQAFRANLSGPPSEGATRLMRIHYSQGNGIVVYPAMAGFGGLGINSAVASYPVYGVDSKNWAHVIAPDIINQLMMETWDGGENWTEIPGLTKLVTNNGNLLFRSDVAGIGPDLPLVTAVSFCPTDPTLVLIGTSEGGIFSSSDRGRTWRKFVDTNAGTSGIDRPTYITSFFWETQNSVFVSTFGRGLWQLRDVRVAVADSFDGLCGGCDVVSNSSGTGRPPFDGSVLVVDGRLLGVRTEKGQLREVFVTPGSSAVFTGDQNDPQDDIAITASDGRDTTQFAPLPKPPKGSIMTGVVFTSGDQLTGTVFAKSALTLTPPESEEEHKGSSESPSKGMPYIRLSYSTFSGVATVGPQEAFDLSAADFVAGASYELLVDDVPVKGSVKADGSGSFTCRIIAPSEPGYHSIAVRIAGSDKAIDRSTLLVRNQN